MGDTLTAWNRLFDRMHQKLDLGKDDLKGLFIETDEARAKFQQFLKDRKYTSVGNVLRYTGADA